MDCVINKSKRGWFVGFEEVYSYYAKFRLFFYMSFVAYPVGLVNPCRVR
jgi:hypothetical protein